MMATGLLDPLAHGVMQTLRPRLRLNVPPAGFNPVTATPEQLAAYFLPPRPDRAQTPLAFEHWHDAMSRRPKFPRNPAQPVDLFAALKPPELPAARKPAELPATPDVAGPMRPTHLRRRSLGVGQTLSLNWSGAYLRPPGFGKMSLVQGRWTVPQPAPPAGADDRTYASSIWVGLDGNDPASRSLPQIGTGQYVTVTGGKPRSELFMWWQWWASSDRRAVQIVVRDFPVSAKDRIYAQVAVLGPKLVSFFVRNLTSDLALAWWYKAPPVGAHANQTPIEVEGRTAEWIVERPAVPGTRQLMPMANYGRATFTHCIAVSATEGACREQQLDNARFVGMNGFDGAAERGAPISTPASKPASAGKPQRTRNATPARTATKAPGKGSSRDSIAVHYVG